MRMSVISATLAGLLVIPLAGMPANASPAIATPPAPSDLSKATNALMRPSDVAGALATGLTRKDAYRIGYTNPPGGQDPLPVCVYAPEYTTVSIPGDRAIGYAATLGAVTQDVYQYASAAAAQREWSRLTLRIPATCRGSFEDAGLRSTLSSTRVPGISGGPQGWGVSDVTNSSAKYSAVHLVGDAIQMVSYTAERSSLPSGTVAGIGRLASSLGARWIDRATAPMTQNATLTMAQTVMMTPADVPTTLPVLPPAKGGWSDFTSYTPQTDMFGCFAVLQKLGAKASYTVGLGETGDVFPDTGAIGQMVYDFGSADAARKAWTRLGKAAAGCSLNVGVPTPASGAFGRQENGVSPLAFDGVPGVWTRELQREDGRQGSCGDASGPKPCPSFSVKSYTIYLLVGDAIQSVYYATGETGLRQVGLDQRSVNVLAEKLANRWMQGASS